MQLRPKDEEERKLCVRTQREEKPVKTHSHSFSLLDPATLENRNARRVFWLLLAFATAVFLIDIRLPRGATLAICYLPLVTVAVGYRSRRPIVVLAGLCTFYTIADMYLSPPSTIPWWVT